jgi:RNA polymerase sigma-70 factor, ECF subfamily
MSSDNTLSAELTNLARRLSRGDLSALGELFDVVAPRLVRYARAITRRWEDSEDAVQAALLRITKNPQSLAAVQFPWAYLLRVVRNEALRLMASRRSYSKTCTSIDPADQSPAVSPSDCEQAEQQAAVQRALSRLPAEQAEVVLLKIWEGLTFQEISVVTGESPNTVASRYRYALAKLELSLRPIAEEVHHA